MLRHPTLVARDIRGSGGLPPRGQVSRIGKTVNSQRKERNDTPTKPRPVRVLFLCNSPRTPAGVEKTVCLLLTHFDRDRVHPRVILNGEGPFADQLRDLNADVEIIPCTRRTSLEWRRRLRESLRRRPADVVQLHLSRLNAPLLRRSGAAVVERLNMTRDPRLRHPLAWPWLDRWTARWIDRFIVVSNTLRAAFFARGYPAYKLRVIHNGVEPPVRADSARLRRELGIADDAPVVGAVGRLTYQKGMDLFLEAVCELRNIDPRIQAVIAGDGELRSALVQQAEHLGIGSCMHFLGYRNNVWDVLAGIDVLLFLSRWEPFANTLLEAMAVGTPIVASDVDGNREALCNGDAGGVLVPPERADLAARAAAQVLTEPPLRAFLSASGRARARDFGVDRMVRLHEELYEIEAQHAAERRFSRPNASGPR